MKYLLTIGIFLFLQSLYGQAGMIEADDGIKIGNSSSTSDGVIRYTGSDFEGLVAGVWESLTGGSSGSSVWTVSGTDAYYNAGDVGIGITNPSSSLHVVGDGSQTELVDFTTGDLSAGDDLLNLTVGSGSVSSSQALEIKRGSTNLFVVNSDGKVGIGSGAPSSELEVFGDLRLSGGSAKASFMEGGSEKAYLHYTGTDFNITNNESAGSLNLSANDDVHIESGLGTGTNSDVIIESGDDIALTSEDDVVINTSDDFFVQTGASFTSRLTIDQAGVTRIGSSVSNNNITFDPTDDSDGGTPVVTSASFKMYDTNGDKTIEAYANAPNNSGGWMSLSDQAGNRVIQLDANSNNSSTPNEGGEFILFDVNGNSNIFMQARESSTQGAHIQLRDFNNNVTIDLDADLNGDGRIITDELQINGGSDFAENFDIIESTRYSDEPLPGMLVSIDPKSTGKLSITTEAFDPKVAGIVSGANGVEPGLFMGQKGSIADGKYPVALTGRVYVYATNENGVVMPGDLLTSSSTPGYAMKARRQNNIQGAIIGKAMTKLEGKKGFVLVLVNLQ